MTFKAYWPHYVAAHRHPVVRRVHVLATGAALACAAAGLLSRQRWLLLCAPGVAVIPARISHRMFDKASFEASENPFYDLVANVLFFVKTLDGSIEQDFAADSPSRQSRESPSRSPQPNMVTDHTLH